VRAALARLRVQRLLAGYRGSAPADIDSAVEAVMRIQRILLTHQDAVDEIELNPLVVGTKGRGAYVVDVLVTDRSRRGSQ
jgi:hypothetical protein